MEEKAKAGPTRQILFLYEATLTLFFATLLYLLMSSTPLRFLFVRGPLTYDLWVRLFFLWGLTFSFLAIVYYGTSYTVTPIQLLMGPIRRLLTSQAVMEAGDATSVEAAGRESEETIEEELASTGRTSAEGTKDEAVYRVLRRAARSAAQLADKMERRINTYLVLGVAMGIVGLGVWYFSFFIGIHPNGAAQPWDRFWEFLPRITILIFIELLAGFFLRQYRIGVEDFKYFLELKRRAEASRIAYTVFDLIQDDKLKVTFASGLLEERSDSRLRKDETTTVLEAMKAEENTTLQLIGLLGSHLEDITKLLPKAKGKG